MKTVTIDDIIDMAIAEMSRETNPRTKEILASLIRHLQEISCDVRQSNEEFLLGSENTLRVGERISPRSKTEKPRPWRASVLSARRPH